jgi:trimethylamine--corrinoid protein Co-methyltransferase
MSGAGLLFGASIFSMEQMLLDTEIFGLIRHLLATPAEAIDETFMPILENVGPGGQFLAERHTVDHMRKLWMPRFFDRKSWEEWEAAKEPGPRGAAQEKLRNILSTHEPVPLEEKMDEEIQRIIRAYVREVR